MKHLINYSILLAFCFVFACSSSEEPEQNLSDFEKNEPSKPRVDISLSRSEAEIVNHLTDFSFDALKSIANESDDNIVFSPLSLSSVLSIMANGAQGETRSELLNLLKTDNLDELNQLNKKLLETLPDLDNNARFNSANAIFYNDVAIQNNFLTTVENYFNTSVFPENAASANGKQILNKWCNDNTWGMIPKYNSGSSDTDIKIFNITAFMARWTKPFEENKTTYGPLFIGENGDAQNVYMMYKEENYLPYYNGENYKATTTPYGNGAFTFTVILPDENSNISDVLNKLSYSKFNEITKNTEYAPIHLTLPRFKINDETDYVDIKHFFNTLGLTNILTGNYSNLVNTNTNVSHSIKHNAVIEICENGTKAAAITGNEYLIGDYIGIPPVDFNVNRPFIYLVHERSTGVILFMGVVRNMN